MHRTLSRSTRRIALLTALLIGTAIGAPPAAQANHNGEYVGNGYTLTGGSALRTQKNFTVQITDQSLESTRPLLQAAIDQIHTQTPFRLTIAPGIQPHDTIQRGEIMVELPHAGRNGGISICGDQSRWVGCGGPINSSGGVISSGAIWIPPNKVLRLPDITQRSVLAHELAHALGLCHHIQDRSVLMDRFLDESDGGTYKAGDIRGLNHLAGCSANCGGGSPGPTPPQPSTPARGPNDPIGVVDGVAFTSSGALYVDGWALDPDSPKRMLNVDVYIGGPAGSASGKRLLASKRRSDIGRAFPGAGAFHGFKNAIGTPRLGSYPIYVYAINARGTPGENTLLLQKTVHNRSPQGVLDQVRVRGSAINIAGWGFDSDDTRKNVAIHAYLTYRAKGGSQVRGFNLGPAAQRRPDIDRVFGAGDRHGFDRRFEAPYYGDATLAVYAINLDGTPGDNQLLYERTLRVGYGKPLPPSPRASSPSLNRVPPVSSQPAPPSARRVPPSVPLERVKPIRKRPAAKPAKPFRLEPLKRIPRLGSSKPGPKAPAPKAR